MVKWDNEKVIRNAGLEEVQAEIKISRRNINNLRYADDTTLMVESGEELKWDWKQEINKENYWNQKLVPWKDQWKW